MADEIQNVMEITKEEEEQKSKNESDENKPKLSRHESLKEFLVMTDEKGDKITLEDTGIDDLISKETAELTDNERMFLYEKAMSFRGLGSNNHALLCFLGCLKGLKPSSKSKFTMLPQCMTHISEIYATAGDYQRAVEFMQGTKLYYETAIIESGLQVDKYKELSSENYSPLDFDPCLDEAKRANEYERLANSCLEQQKFQLALEYCGKATKLRQKAYGDEHPLTIKSLDLFTLIYAEMGKSQYSEAMNKVGDIVKQYKIESEQAQKKAVQADASSEKDNNETTKKTEDSDDSTAAGDINLDGTKGDQDKDNDENNIETNDQNEKTDGNKKQQVHFEENPTNQDNTEQHTPEISLLNEITPKMFFIVFLFSSLSAVFATVSWCIYTDSTICPTRGYFYAKAKYLYYYYWVTTDPDVNLY
eukprot:TCONS_00064135-protein